MYCIKLHKRVNQAVNLFYRLGLWHRGDVATVGELRMKIFYSIYFLLFPISLLAGAIKSDNKDEVVLLTESSIMIIVTAVRLLYIIWRKDDIVGLLHRVGVYTIKEQEDFNLTNEKVTRFMKLMTFSYFYSIAMCICGLVVIPILGNERKLFFNIGFPLDYNNTEMSYWIAFFFLVTEGFIAEVSILFSILIWFLLLTCGLKYEMLGNELKNMGVVRHFDEFGKKLKISEVETQNLFSRDLIGGMKSYDDINESTQQVESFLSKILTIQLATSAICICASIYCLAFINKESFLETKIYIFYLSYNIFDIFIVLYFGNEIKLFSDRLSYCLFESNWIDQPQSCKKCMIIFGERLKQAQQLVIFKIYPLTLDTFTRILNSAYSMFNILKNLT